MVHLLIVSLILIFFCRGDAKLIDIHIGDPLEMYHIERHQKEQQDIEDWAILDDPDSSEEDKQKALERLDKNDGMS